MLDYKLLEALSSVIDEGGFDRAARKLHLTQSAISQRIRALEDSIGQALIIRATPVRPTEAGQRLLAHYQQVYHLESDLLTQMCPSPGNAPSPIAIAVNEDSLATWFFPVLLPFLAEQAVLLDLYTDDQEETHALLRTGKVAGCISTRPDPIQGCRCIQLGRMNYHCLAAPSFCNRWFPEGLTATAMRHAPAVTFNRKDKLHCRFVSEWGLTQTDFSTHYVPSSEIFVEMIKAGLAYGMVPHPQGNPLLTCNLVRDLAPEKSISVSLYWHHWNLGTTLMNTLSKSLVQRCATYLLTEPPSSK